MKNKAVKAGIGYTIGNYLIKGLVFFTIPIFSRLLTTADYGTYNTYLAYESIITNIVALAMHMSFKNAKYDYGKNYNSYVSSIVLLQSVNLLIWILFVFVLRQALTNFTGMSTVVLILLVIQSFGTGILADYNADIGLNYSYKKYIVIAGFNSVSNISISLILILTLFKNERYLGRIVGTVVPYFFIIIYIFTYFFKKAKPTVSKLYWNYGIKFSLPLIPHAISQVILNQFDRIMITTMVGSSESGIYSFAYNIYSIVYVIMTSLDSVWGPWFFQKKHQGNEAAIRKQSTNYIFGMLILCCALIVVSPEIIKLLGPKEYWDSMYCVIPIVCAGFFMFLYTIPCQVEYYYKRTALIAVGTSAAAIINIITNYIFIKMFGYVAAAYTTLGTYILYFLFHYLFALHIEGKQLFDTKKIILCSVILLGIGFISLAFIKIPLIRFAELGAIVICAFAWSKKNFNIKELLR